ncbi:MAG: hypothetical protein AB1422_10960 [bacterium]
MTNCYNDPINWIDPLGLCGEKPWWVIDAELEKKIWADVKEIAEGMCLGGVIKGIKVHKSKIRPSTAGKHEKGISRKKRDRPGGEKGDKYRPYRRK